MPTIWKRWRMAVSAEVEERKKKRTEERMNRMRA
jgi:hypothetical protein